MKAVLIEYDYKGYYSRYALSEAEFEGAFKSHLAQGMAAPNDRGDSYTLAPMVHVWYALTEVGSDLWNKFFNDMQYGLPESDIESGNKAYVDTNVMRDMVPHLPAKYRKEIVYHSILSRIIHDLENCAMLNVTMIDDGVAVKYHGVTAGIHIDVLEEDVA